ncbi:MAG: ATP-binding cassette domain-containing protein [Lachnospiraceae bacterium]
MTDLAIETNELTKCYGKQTVVDNVNMHVEQGKIYGLLGRNGAGKSTIMKMILGLTGITHGAITIFGENLKEQPRSLYTRIGNLIESPCFYPNLTGTENLLLFSKLRGTVGRNVEKHALETVGLPYKDSKVFSKYSLGMKQRLAIANAIIHDPELLILDEPVNGLDPIGIAEMRDLLNGLRTEQKKTILISSHILSEISMLADTVGIIHSGVLLTEKSRIALENQNKKYILMRVSSSSKVSNVLEQQCSIFKYSVESDTELRIYQPGVDIGKVIKMLVLNDITVRESQVCNDSLEDYFRKITGGDGIA